MFPYLLETEEHRQIKMNNSSQILKKNPNFLGVLAVTMSNASRMLRILDLVSLARLAGLRAVRYET